MSDTPTIPVAPSIARVYLNGIVIGSVPVEQHQQLQADAKRDYWLYLCQMCNWLWVIFSVLTKAIAFIPVLLTMLLFFIALFASSHDLGGGLIDMANKVANMDPQEIGKIIKFYFAILLGFSSLAMVIALVLSDGKNFGYRNRFEERVNFQLRDILEAPAQGEITVIHWPVFMAEGQPSDQS